MQLYKLSEKDVSSIIEQSSPKHAVQQGKLEIISDHILSDYGYPIKVVITCERDRIVVITAYPLKRRSKS